MKNIKFFLLGFTFLLFVIAFLSNFPERSLDSSAISKLSEKISQKCSLEDGNNECYENEILKIARSTIMSSSFAITKEVQKLSPSYAYCHVLAHKLSFIESKRRPNDWKNIITECPFNMCNYGCLHGSLVERYRGEVLDDFQINDAIIELKDICEPRGSWNPSHLDKNMCYHALGHLSMYMTGADVKKSLRVCNEVSVKPSGEDFYETCIEGVFMTIFQGIDPEEVALVAEIKPEVDQVRSFCSKYDGIDYEACNREAFPFFSELIKNPKYLSDFCSYSKNEYGLWKCYAIAISSVTINFLESQSMEGLSEYCLSLNSDRRSQCFSVASTRTLQNDIGQIDKAIGICKMADKEALGGECYQNLIFFFNSAYNKNDPKIEEFCKMIPGHYYQKCLTNYENNI